MHRTLKPLALTILALVCLATTTNTEAMLNPRLGTFMQRDTGGVSHMRPGAGYQDGMNLYAAHHVQQGGLDPSGNVVVFVHGINSQNVGDIEEVYGELKETWGKDENQALVHFRYTRNGREPNWEDAAAGTRGTFWQGNLNRVAGEQLAKLISHLKKERDRIVKEHGKDCWEPINILAYSNGSNVAYHALHTFGESVDNLVIVGGSLDDRASISKRLANNSGHFYNFWSTGDETTELVDGIGSDGLRDSISRRNDVTDRHIRDVQHSAHSGVSASDEARVRPGLIDYTTWLTRYMARENYASILGHGGIPGLSKHGTLPAGTNLAPNKAFNYRIDMIGIAPHIPAGGRGAPHTKWELGDVKEGQYDW